MMTCDPGGEIGVRDFPLENFSSQMIGQPGEAET